jgi:nicotinamide phosphoribosyltransferase
LKETILARKENEMGLAKVVFRPDSGDPVKVICGDADAEPGSPAYKGAVECLWEIFGGEVTDEGYKILNQRVGVIYGDSITLQRAQAILEGLAAKGFASNNIVFGIGSFTYQYLTRDNFGFALKATWGQVNGEAREIFKDPITDNGEKKSARGLLRVEETENGFEMFDQQTAEQEKQGAFKVVFEDGKLVVDQSLEEIRNRLAG